MHEKKHRYTLKHMQNILNNGYTKNWIKKLKKEGKEHLKEKAKKFSITVSSIMYCIMSQYNSALIKTVHIFF